MTANARLLCGDDTDLLEEGEFVRASPALDHLAVFEL